MDVVVQVLRTLAERDSDFFKKFADLPKHGRTRRYLAKNQEELYPSRPDLTRMSKEIAPGWWIGTNYANRDKLKILKMACEVAGIRFGSDLKVNM